MRTAPGLLSISLFLLIGCAGNRTALHGGARVDADGAGATFALGHERFAKDGKIGYGGALVAEDAGAWRTGVALHARYYLARGLDETWLSGDRRAYRGRPCVESDKVCVRRRREKHALGLGVRLDGGVEPAGPDLVWTAAPELHARWSGGTPFYIGAELGYGFGADRADVDDALDRGAYARITVGVQLYIDLGYPTPQIGGHRLPIPDP